ncbi:uncharacterized protein LOC122570267 [Bombus pyrosoma]|uniref:uncharacterized protein LOC122570267 n=1 Tax=Bombus pyrosoma TaxID=396416 RepID=UPI001CB946E3|nr:uncharacterized protein LOC122570267 [Bombus pyrosoma]
MAALVSSNPVVECERKKKYKKRRRKHKPRKRNPNHLRRRGRRSGVMCRRWRESMLLEGPSSIQAGEMASSSVSHSGSFPVVDLTLFDEDTVELPPSSPPIEVLDANNCAKIRFPKEIPAEVLDDYLRNHRSGEKWVLPTVMLVMDMKVPAFVQPVQRKRRRDSKNVWMAREANTNDCAKADFPEWTSAGVLDVLLCYRSSGQSSLLCCMFLVLVIMILNGEYGGVFVKGSLCRLSHARGRRVSKCVSGPRRRSQRVKRRGQEGRIV